jgi:hypothetical protein
MAPGQKPYLLQVLPCESGVFDLGSGAWVLSRPLHTVTPGPGKSFPFLLNEIWLYTQLTDAIGAFALSVQLRMPQTGAIGGRSPPISRSFPTNRMDVVEEVFHLIKIPFRRPGLYEFHVLVNHVELAPSARLVVR